MSDPIDTKIGYKKPPISGRFQKGVSGNPRGRPRGSKNYNTLLVELLRSEGPRDKGARHRSTAEKLLEGLIDKAIASDSGAVALVWELMLKYDTMHENAVVRYRRKNFDIEKAMLRYQNA